MSATVTSVLCVLCAVVAVLVASLTAALAAYLARADGATIPAALTRAGAAFGVTLTMIAAMATSVASLLMRQ